MTLFRKVKLAITAWHSWRKGNRMATEIVKSKTTQNTVAGVGGVAATVAAVIAFLRSVKPEWIPWGTDGDAAIVGVIATVIGPLVSRKIAFLRDPSKRDGAAPATVELSPGVELLEVVRISTGQTADLWTEFRGTFAEAVDAGAQLIHCTNENVYRPDGTLSGHMALPPSMR